MSSPQVEFLKNLISSAEAGNEEGVALLRQVCASAVAKAPPRDLVTLGRCLAQIGDELTEAQIRRN